MRCDRARSVISAAFDGEAEPALAAEVDQHLATCASCREFLSAIQRIRRRVRYEPVEEVPDIAGRVLPRIGARRRSWIGQVAAALVAGSVIGAVLAGAGPASPPQLAATDIPRRVLDIQTTVRSLEAQLRVVETGWHPQVPVRTYRGILAYHSPESLLVRLDDLTKYPSPEWKPNNVVSVVDDGLRWWKGPLLCSPNAQPECAGGPIGSVTRNEAPFAGDRLPLDLVVPVQSFASGPQPRVIGTTRISERPAIGIATTVGQVEPILRGILAVGSWRELHSTDQVELWLDRQLLVPLAARVTAGDGLDRASWAVREGYRDPPGTDILTIDLSQVRINLPLQVEAESPPTGLPTADAGFVDLPWQMVGVPTPALVPDEMEPHRAGRQERATPGVEVRSWSDGRGWLAVRAAAGWEGPGLFGASSSFSSVRKVQLSDGGVAYSTGSTVMVHGSELDLQVAGSLSESDLLEVADSLGLRGLVVPDDWPEARLRTVDEAAELVPGLLLPQRLAGFSTPSVLETRSGARLVYEGPGTLRFELMESSGDTLKPPLDAEIRGVSVRGVDGRYTPARGELEWVEDHLVVTLRSPTLSLGELVFIAGLLEAP